jgi:hypothetical protein
MASRENYLIERLDGELRKRGYSRGRDPAEGRLPWIDAAYRHPSGIVLCVECKLPNVYRAEEFRGLIGDAILRFREAGSPPPGAV